MRKSRRKKAEDLGIRINDQISASEVRVLTDDGENIGVLSLKDAMKEAASRGKDLVELSPNARPVVVKITDYGQYKYDLKRKTRDAKQKQKTVETKTVQVKPNTGEGDLIVKAKNISKWLKEGHRIKVELYLRGRIKYAEKDFLQERMERVLHFVSEPYTIADGPKKSPKGLTAILEKASKKQIARMQELEESTSTNSETSEEKKD